MIAFHQPFLSRRVFLAAGGAAAAVSALPGRARAASTSEYRLVAGPGRAHLVGGSYPDTAVWAYNDQVPGPVIRARQGQRLRIAVENRLHEVTTVHWHGLRVPNPMDGVPHLTQPPIAPGETFVYEFDLPDAGTYWYHPHQRSFEQVGRGLYGPFIVEEEDPIRVDRDVTWVLDDWRLLPDAQISDDFGNLMDASHNGRMGNTVTINGRIQEAFAVRAGERLRLRLINVANARIFGLELRGHRPRVIALDGQPVEPHEPEGGRIVLGPAMRADLVVDMPGEPGDRFAVIDTFYRGSEYRLLDLIYDSAPPVGAQPLEAPIGLPPNSVPEPELEAAERYEVTLYGGMMGGGMGGMMGGGQGMMHGMVRGTQRSGIWGINGFSMTDHAMEPFLTLRRGRSCVLAMHNNTTWHHPMHLHGHAFRVIARNGQPTRHQEWQDTVLLAPYEGVDIAFVADNPGELDVPLSRPGASGRRDGGRDSGHLTIDLTKWRDWRCIKTAELHNGLFADGPFALQHGAGVIEFFRVAVRPLWRPRSPGCELPQPTLWHTDWGVPPRRAGATDQIAWRFALTSFSRRAQAFPCVWSKPCPRAASRSWTCASTWRAL